MEIRQDNFSEFEQYEALTDEDIFTKIWTQPRRVLKYINDTHYEKYFYILLFFAGVSGAFDRASMKNMGDNVSLLTIMLSCVLGGGFLGWISYYIYAALLSWTGKWLDGKGNTSSIYRIIIYASVPSILSLLLLVPQLVVYGEDVFKSYTDLTDGGIVGNIIFWGSVLFEVVLSCITFVFMVIGISEVQKISVGKAVFNLILPFLVIIVPILLILMMVYAL